jgi:asparagine synthase (glutamine-hydrolysing)
MFDESGRLAIVFNGEIYNYRELRADLAAHGVRFRTHSDTEVVLYLYQRYGTEMFGRLRGMYALVLWDGDTRKLVAARDPFGIKPLYFADDGKSVRMASQVKALLAGGGVERRPSAAGHVGFLLWGSVPEPYTLYSTIRAVPPGHYRVYGDEGLKETVCFCRIRDVLAAGGAEIGRVNGGGPLLREVVLDSVRHHLVSDVPVGIFLSAGRDSTAIAALASECSGDMRSLTLGYQEYRGTLEDETVVAEEVARQFGLRHTTAWISADDFDPEVILASMDQPSIDGINTYLVSRGAAQAGFKVVLSGLGGDEVFGGYGTFERIPAMARWMKGLPRMPWLLRLLDRVLPEGRRKFAGVVEYGRSYAGAYLLSRCLNVPWMLAELADPKFLAEGWVELETEKRLAETTEGLTSPFNKVAALEMEWYMRNQLLRDSDWASMAHSLELRVPLVDIEVLRAQARRSRPWSKQDLVLTPKKALPAAVVHRPKTGFCVPTSRWAAEKIGLRDGAKLRPWGSYVYQQFVGDRVKATAIG